MAKKPAPRPKATSAQAASRAGKVLSSPRSTKGEKSAAASVLSSRASGKITRQDSLFKIIGLGKSGVPGGLSRKKH